MKAKLGYFLLATVAIAAIVTLGGCKKKEQPPPSSAIGDLAKTAHKTAEETKKEATPVAEEAKKTVAAAAAEIEQTLCPVMDGNKIDKNVFVEHKGKKVYFCCPECKAKFLA